MKKNFTLKNSLAVLGIAVCAIICTIFSSCSMYDEQDTTIIAYLKINDLLENKLSKTCHSEIEQLKKAYKEHNDAALVSGLFGLNVNVDFDYDTDAIKAFNKKYTAADGKSVKLEELEADITSELWNYLNQNYADAIPAKAQNTAEGRYYTITELKAKYPDYKELEIEDFSPMELVNSVVNEKLFDFSMLSEGDVNLRTLYVYYLANKPAESTIENGKSELEKDAQKLHEMYCKAEQSQSEEDAAAMLAFQAKCLEKYDKKEFKAIFGKLQLDGCGGNVEPAQMDKVLHDYTLQYFSAVHSNLSQAQMEELLVRAQQFLLDNKYVDMEFFTKKYTVSQFESESNAAASSLYNTMNYLLNDNTPTQAEFDETLPAE